MGISRHDLFRELHHQAPAVSPTRQRNNLYGSFRSFQIVHVQRGAAQPAVKLLSTSGMIQGVVQPAVARSGAAQPAFNLGI